MIKTIFVILLVCFELYLFYLIYRNWVGGEILLKINYANYGNQLSFLNQFDSDLDFRPHEEEYRALQAKCDELFDRYSYNKLVLSFKPLKLEKWFTPEEVDWIENGYAYYKEHKNEK